MPVTYMRSHTLLKVVGTGSKHRMPGSPNGIGPPYQWPFRRNSPPAVLPRAACSAVARSRLGACRRPCLRCNRIPGCPCWRRPAALIEEIARGRRRRKAHYRARSVGLLAVAALDAAGEDTIDAWRRKPSTTGSAVAYRDEFEFEQVATGGG